MTDNPLSWRGLVAIAGGAPSLIAVIAAVLFALDGNTPGLLMVIAMLLAAILFVLATKEWTG